jgi:UTP--glucose-1-phosphate uridylyltransferase
MANGGHTLLFSNVDNLGATPDPEIVGFHLAQGVQMTVEVAPKEPGDRGGAPALVDGRLQLVEGFAFPQGFDQDQVPVFNTATYCFDAMALDGTFELPWYIVEKRVEDQPVIQFEHLAGDLSTCLLSAYLQVDRQDRFIPVKTQGDVPEAQGLLKKKEQRILDSLASPEAT